MIVLTSTHHRVLDQQQEMWLEILAERSSQHSEALVRLSELFQAQLAAQKEQIDALMTRNADLAAMLVRPTHDQKAVKRLLDRNEDLMDRLQEMVGTVHLHQVRQYGGTDTPSTPVPGPSDASLYTSEDEQDLRALHEQDLISSGELEAALRELGYANDSIQFE